MGASAACFLRRSKLFSMDAHAILRDKDRIKTQAHRIPRHANAPYQRESALSLSATPLLFLCKGFYQKWQGLPLFRQGLPKKWQALPVTLPSLRKNRHPVYKIKEQEREFSSATGVFLVSLGKTLNNLYLCRKPLTKH